MPAPLLVQLTAVPNLVTVVRLLLLPLIAYGLSQNSTRWMIITAVAFACAAFSDWLDGFLARRLGQITDLGRMLDPIADKLLIGVLVVMLARAGSLPAWVAVVIVVRDVTILLFGLTIVRGKGFVPQADLVGKYAMGSFVWLVAFAWIGFSFGRNVFIVVTIVLVATSSVRYLADYLRWRRSDGPTPRAPAAPAGRLATIVRRSLVGILVTVVAVKLLFWVGTNDKMPTDHRVLAPHPAAMELLARYAPVLYFARDEFAFPVDVAAMLDRSELWRDFGLLFRVGDRRIAQPPLAPAKLAEDSSPSMYLDLRGQRNAMRLTVRDVEHRYRRIVYGRAVMDRDGPDDYIVLQYWFFYLVSGLGSTSFVFHEGDWETVSFYLDRDQRPRHASYSQHFYADSRAWEFVEKDAGAPVVYVARGGHASYFSPGVHVTFSDNEKVIRLGRDRTERSIRWTASRDYAVELIDDATPWVAFRGMWGETNPRADWGPRYRNPRDPALAMWSHPVRWMKRYLPRA